MVYTLLKEKEREVVTMKFKVFINEQKKSNFIESAEWWTKKVAESYIDLMEHRFNGKATCYKGYVIIKTKKA